MKSAWGWFGKAREATDAAVLAVEACQDPCQPCLGTRASGTSIALWRGSEKSTVSIYEGSHAVL